MIFGRLRARTIFRCKGPVGVHLSTRELLTNVFTLEICYPSELPVQFLRRGHDPKIQAEYSMIVAIGKVQVHRREGDHD